jgi:hypothetical protein
VTFYSVGRDMHCPRYSMRTHRSEICPEEEEDNHHGDGPDQEPNAPW